jgi:hypothetical protein
MQGSRPPGGAKSRPRRRLRDRKDLAHVCIQKFAKIPGILRKHAAAVPQRGQRELQWSAPVRYASDAKPIAMGWQDGGHNRHPVSGLGEGQEGVRGATLDENIRLEPCEAAGAIKRVADHEAGFQEQERIGGKAAYFDASARPEPKRFVAGGKKFERRQRKALELMTFGLTDLQEVYSKVQFSTLQLFKRFGANRLAQFDLHVGKACRIAMQERRKDPVDHLRGGRDLEDAGIGPPQQPGSLAERVHRAQDVAAIGEQSIAFAGQDQPFANAIEQPESKLDLEIIDLAGQGGLSDSQAKRRLRDGSLLGNRDKRSHVAQIHAGSLCPFGMNKREI